jgi:hypothetical protein
MVSVVFSVQNALSKLCMIGFPLIQQGETAASSEKSPSKIILFLYHLPPSPECQPYENRNFVF